MGIIWREEQGACIFFPRASTLHISLAMHPHEAGIPKHKAKESSDKKPSWKQNKFSSLQLFPASPLDLAEL